MARGRNPGTVRNRDPDMRFSKYPPIWKGYRARHPAATPVGMGGRGRFFSAMTLAVA
jgi:hypothetical protein